jgi:hypothetical protein
MSSDRELDILGGLQGDVDVYMSRLKPKKLRLSGDHRWRAQANHKILVLDRGAVRLEYPETWVVEATDDCVKIHDKTPPDDDCVLGVSCHRWPAIAAPELTVAALVRETLESDERSLFELDPIVEETHIDLTLAWGQGRFIDPLANREACARLCLARKSEIQALITFDFWLSDLALCHAQWNAFLASLQLGQWVADPQRGPPLS